MTGAIATEAKYPQPILLPKMSNTPKSKTIQGLLLFYINKYYLIRERIPGLKTRQKEHLHEVEKINKTYLKELAKREDWNTEENREQFKKEIDFLTKCYTKQRQEEERKKALQDFKISMKQKRVTGI